MRSNYGDFLQRLCKYRNSVNLTQEKISVLLGVTQSQFSKMELGKTIMSYKSLEKLMKSGWDIDYLITGKKFEYGESELIQVIQQNECVYKQEVLRAVAWLLQQGISKCISEPNFETKCEIAILSHRAEGDADETVLYEIRKILGISQINMSEQLGVNIKKYRMLEKGKVNPDAELMLQIYEKTGCKPSLMLNRGNVEQMIVSDLWQQIEKCVQTEILEIVRKILNFLEM